MDDSIGKAMREGKFDNLSGKGKPLNFEEHPHEDPDWRLAHHVLKENGFTLPWIQARQEVEVEIQAALTALRRAWDRRQAALENSGASAYHAQEWLLAVSKFTDEAARINRLIRDYNLQTPSLNFQLPPLNAEREIDRLKAI
jgi:DnaJ family protein C protein 28